MKKILTLICGLTLFTLLPAGADSALGNYLCVAGPTVVSRGAASAGKAERVVRRIEATDEKTLEVSITGLARPDELKALRGLKAKDFLKAISANRFGTVTVAGKSHPVQLAFTTPAPKDGTRVHLLAGRPWGWQGTEVQAKAGSISYMTFVLPSGDRVGHGALHHHAGISLEQNGAVKVVGATRVTTPLKRVRRN